MNYYKVVCEPLDDIIQLNVLTAEGEKDLLERVYAKVKSKSTFSVDSYKESIIRVLVKDVPTWLTSVVMDDPEIKTFYINSIFNSILKIYPFLDLEFLCNSSNMEHFLDKQGSSVIINAKKKSANKSSLPSVLGEIIPAIALSSIEDIVGAKTKLESQILGQEEAISKVIKTLKLMSTGFSTHASLFFVGQTGVGKTELAKILGEFYGGNFCKINCAEYTNSHEYAKLIGAPPGYIGHSEDNLLGEKAKISNQWILLFDEIEKAHYKLHDFLLSLLDDGTCTDNLGRVLDFSNSIFIFTSNQGIKDIKYNSIGFMKKEVHLQEAKETILNSVKSKFSPEFMNRLDEVVCFNPLTPDIVRGIAQKELETFPVSITPELLDYVVEHGFSLEYGARNVRRFIKDKLAILLADELLASRVPKGKNNKYTISFTSGTPSIVNTVKYKKATQ